MRLLKTDKVLPDRRPNDEYLTPYAEIEAAYGHLLKIAPQYDPYRVRKWREFRILDVGANTGRWGRTARKLWPDAIITGVELQEQPQPDGYDYWCAGTDFRDWKDDNPGSFDLIVGNPPFYCAEELVRTALSLLSLDGALYFLLPTEFRHGQRRYLGLYQEFPLKWWCPFTGRINWDGCGSSNPRDYAMYFWEPGFHGDFRGLPIHVEKEEKCRKGRTTSPSLSGTTSGK